MAFKNKPPPGILDKSLSKGKTEMKSKIATGFRQLITPSPTINMSTYGLLFSEIVRYSQNRVNTIAELQNKLSDMGRFVGERLLDVIVFREKGTKRETRLLSMLIFLKGTIWRNLFGKEADKLERSNEDPSTYLLIEKEPLVNTFISVPKDKGSLNCAAFIAGIIEAVLNGSNFPAKVGAHWHNNTTYYVIQFDESVMNREKQAESR